MYSRTVRAEALALLDAGRSLSSVSSEVGVSRSTLREWCSRSEQSRAIGDCWLCDDTAPPSPGAYSRLFGYYLGDGCISADRRAYVLRVSCDRVYPCIVEDVSDTIVAVRPRARTQHVPAPGVVVVQSGWKHWPCLFPQHGPGRKHERRLTMEPWQRALVGDYPGDFLRGLFHSDGCRAKNWTRRLVAGEMKRYDYPRWQFTNNSEDIRRWCCEALDLVGVAWRQSNWKTISVSTRAGVARLDVLIGPKA